MVGARGYGIKFTSVFDRGRDGGGTGAHRLYFTLGRAPPNGTTTGGGVVSLLLPGTGGRIRVVPPFCYGFNSGYFVRDGSFVKCGTYFYSCSGVVVNSNYCVNPFYDMCAFNFVPRGPNDPISGPIVVRGSMCVYNSIGVVPNTGVKGKDIVYTNDIIFKGVPDNIITTKGPYIPINGVGWRRTLGGSWRAGGVRPELYPNYVGFVCYPRTSGFHLRTQR